MNTWAPPTPTAPAPAKRKRRWWIVAAVVGGLYAVGTIVPHDDTTEPTSYGAEELRLNFNAMLRMDQEAFCDLADLDGSRLAYNASNPDVTRSEWETFVGVACS